MSEKEVLGYRMLQKRDSDQNWNISNFKPESGEIIILNEDIEGHTPQRIRIGNSKDSAKDLKNIVGELYVQSEQPEYAGEGAVWITPNSNIASTHEIENETSNKIQKIQITEKTDGSIEMINFFEDNTFETIILAAGDNPESVIYNGTAIPIDWIMETEVSE